MTLYDEEGNVITLEISDNIAVLEALTAQNEKLEMLNKCQAEIISELQNENKILTEMNQYTAYIFILVIFSVLYKVLGSALSSMFGGG